MAAPDAPAALVPGLRFAIEFIRAMADDAPMRAVTGPSALRIVARVLEHRIDAETSEEPTP